VDTARIAALLEPFLEQPLPALQLDQISTYIDLLLRWNARINLTAIRHLKEIVPRHFGESFFLASHLFPNGPSVAQSKDPYPPTAPRVLDIGSGAGFPAIPLKIWTPAVHLTLVESNHKKAAFLREVARALTLTNIDVRTDRAETVAADPDFPRTNVVTLRAVEHFKTILPQAIKLLAPQATLALLIGKSQLPHLNTQATINWSPPIPVPRSEARLLAIGINNKVA
jgi:16S rRNA (guanine527-N7)-methyltransferase